MRISDWISDVCASDLGAAAAAGWLGVKRSSAAARHAWECSPSPVYGRRCPKSLPPRRRGADEGARAQRSAAFDYGGWQGEKSKSSSLRSRPHPALLATFSRFAGEGLGCWAFRGEGTTGTDRKSTRLNSS